MNLLGSNEFKILELSNHGSTLYEIKWLFEQLKLLQKDFGDSKVTKQHQYISNAGPIQGQCRAKCSDNAAPMKRQCSTNAVQGTADHYMGKTNPLTF